MWSLPSHFQTLFDLHASPGSASWWNDLSRVQRCLQSKASSEEAFVVNPSICLGWSFSSSLSSELSGYDELRTMALQIMVGNTEFEIVLLIINWTARLNECEIQCTVNVLEKIYSLEGLHASLFSRLTCATWQWCYQSVCLRACIWYWFPHPICLTRQLLWRIVLLGLWRK